jgi:hypothetical protein
MDICKCGIDHQLRISIRSLDFQLERLYFDCG